MAHDQSPVELNGLPATRLQNENRLNDVNTLQVCYCVDFFAKYCPKS